MHVSNGCEFDLPMLLLLLLFVVGLNAAAPYLQMAKLGGYIRYLVVVVLGGYTLGFGGWVLGSVV